MTRRALITGVAGQDGTYLTEQLLGEGYEVFGVAGPDPGPSFEAWSQRLPAGFSVVAADMRDAASLQACVRDVGPDEIYNFAGLSSVGFSWEHGEATAEVNAVGVVRLLDAMRAHAPHARFCQASSADIFGRAEYAPQDEGTPINPISPYGASKAYAHMIVGSYRQGHGLFACSAILFNHESPRRPADFVTSKIAEGAASIKLGLQEELHLGNLDARRDWGFAGDYVRAMSLMLRADDPDDYVVASGASHTVREFADAAFSQVGLDYRDHVVVDPAFFRPLDPSVQEGNAAKAGRVLGWEPTVGLSGIVAMMVDAAMERLTTQA